MKAAIKRAEARAEKAFYLVNETEPAHIDAPAVCDVIRNIERELATLKELVKCGAPENS